MAFKFIKKFKNGMALTNLNDIEVIFLLWFIVFFK